MNDNLFYINQEVPDKLRKEVTQFENKLDLLYKLKDAQLSKETIYAHAESVDDTKGTVYLNFMDDADIEGYIELEDITYPKGNNKDIHIGRSIACVGNIIPVKIVEIENEKDGLVRVKCSRRLAVEEIEKKYDKDIENNVLAEGSLVKGLVTGMDKSRVFINLGGDVDAILGIGDISRSYVQTPSDVLKIGDVLDLGVKKVYPKSKNKHNQIYISLSRAMLLDGWDKIDQDRKIKEGRIVTGTIKSKILGGVFVELNDSFEGVAGTHNLLNNYCYGDSVKVKILNIDIKRQKINLKIIENQ